MRRPASGHHSCWRAPLCRAAQMVANGSPHWLLTCSSRVAVTDAYAGTRAGTSLRAHTASPDGHPHGGLRASVLRALANGPLAVFRNRPTIRDAARRVGA